VAYLIVAQIYFHPAGNLRNPLPLSFITSYTTTSFQYIHSLQSFFGLFDVLLYYSITMDGDPAVEPELDSFSLTLPLPYRVALTVVLGISSLTFR